MPYTRDIQVGKKVTVTASREGYTSGSVVINQMPNQDITREIRLVRNAIEMEVIYGPNTENPGAPVNAYEGVIQGDENNKLFSTNGNELNIIYVNNDKFPYFRIEGSQYVIQCGVPTGILFGDLNYRGIKYICNYPNSVYTILTNNTKHTILLYKRIVVKITYTYNNGETIRWGSNNLYCSEIDDYPIQSLRNALGPDQENYGFEMFALAIGYTYTIVFKINNSYITRTVTISPTAQEIEDGLINLNFSF